MKCELKYQEVVGNYSKGTDFYPHIQSDSCYRISWERDAKTPWFEKDPFQAPR